jgi:hypothetical protein
MMKKLLAANKGKRGRPRVRYEETRVTVRFRTGRDDAILTRLKQLPPGRRAVYIRNVLAGAPVEALDEALARETERTAATLDRLGTMWGEEEL